MAIDGTGANKWCPLCDGFGGWDYFTSKVRHRLPEDNQDKYRKTYVPCIWCGQGNVVRRVR